MSTDETPDNKSAKKRGMSPRIAMVIGAVLLIALLMFSVLPRIRQNRALAQDAKNERTALRQVTFITPQPTPNTDLTLPGSTQAIEDAIIASRTTGYVRKRYVDIGDRVKVGQLLAEIEAPDVEASVRQAQRQTAQVQAAVLQAQSDVANKQATVAQYQSNVKQTQANVEQARAQEADAEAKLAQAISQLGSAQAQLSQQEHVVDIKRAALAQANTQPRSGRCYSEAL